MPGASRACAAAPGESARLREWTSAAALPGRLGGAEATGPRGAETHVQTEDAAQGWVLSWPSGGSAVLRLGAEEASL